MSPAREKQLVRGLWALHAALALVGLGLFAEALFAPRPPHSFAVRLPAAEAVTELRPLGSDGEGLAARRFTRRVVASAPAAPAAAKAQDQSLDRLIKLTGILDFGGKKPTLAVLETPSESKAYKAGDRVGETGVVVKDVKDFVIVEFEKRRFKVTFLGIQELPADAVGKD